MLMGIIVSLLLCRYGILFDPIPGIVIFLAHPQKWPCACLVLGEIISYHIQYSFNTLMSLLILLPKVPLKSTFN